jgi:NifU-like protein involved in Fe-S cluster formation
MSDPLYAKELLRLAAQASGAGRLVPCDAEGRAYNPACGDRVEVTLRIDPRSRIDAIAHETKACVLAQASASILGAHLPGADEATIIDLRAHVARMLQEGSAPPIPFGDYAALRGAASFRNRHACVLLPIDAVLNAFARR